MSNKEVSKQESSVNRFWQYIRKNIFSVLMIIAIGIIFVSPDAKSFILRCLLTTGLFNAGIDKPGNETSNETKVNFNFEDEEGNVQSVSSLRGKVIFINFWASWCPPCRAEFPSIETLYSKFRDNPGISFLTINEDSDLAVAKAYLSKEEYSLPFYTSSGLVPREIYSGTLPTTVVLDKNGEIRFHHTGFANYASDKFMKQIEELIGE